MHPVVFGLTYLGSWLLMGLGVFLAFRVVRDLRRVSTGKMAAAQAKAMEVGSLVRLALIALIVLVSVGVVYAGAYTFYNLMIVG